MCHALGGSAQWALRRVGSRGDASKSFLQYAAGSLFPLHAALSGSCWHVVDTPWEALPSGCRDRVAVVVQAEHICSLQWDDVWFRLARGCKETCIGEAKTCVVCCEAPPGASTTTAADAAPAAIILILC